MVGLHASLRRLGLVTRIVQRIRQIFQNFSVIIDYQYLLYSLRMCSFYSLDPTFFPFFPLALSGHRSTNTWLKSTFSNKGDDSD